MVILVCAATLLAPWAAADAVPASPASPVQVFVQLSEPPLAAAADGKAQQKRVIAQQERFLSAMNGAGVKATVIYRVSRALNGVALNVPADQVELLRNLPGVKSVEITELQQLNDKGTDSSARAPKRRCSRRTHASTD